MAIVGSIVLFDAVVRIVASHLASHLFWRETWSVYGLPKPSITGVLLAILFLMTVSFVLQSYQRRRNAFQYFKRLGIPGPKPHIIKGNGDRMRNHSLVPIHVMDQWQEEFGHLYGYYVGMKPYVVVRDLDMVQQVLIRDFHKFVNRPAMGIEIRPVIDTLVGLRSQRWKEVRRVISPAFTGRKMRKISGTINRCVDVMMEVVGQHADNQAEIDFFTLFQGLTCQVFCN